MFSQHTVPATVLNYTELETLYEFSLTLVPPIFFL